MMRLPKVRLAALLIAAVVLTGCAAHYAAETAADPYGFLSGIWHGIVFPLALLANLISWFVGFFGISFLDSIQLIGRPNTGLWYYVGFALGFATYGSGAK